MTTATIGIDLASQPKTTALCAIEWDSRSARVATLVRGVDIHGTPLHDKLLACALEGLWGDIPKPSKVAIDAPLGWPIDFVRGIADPAAWPVSIDDPRDRLLRRATDRWVHEETGKQPLSVSSDKIAYPAMRAVGLLANYAHRTDERPDRSGVTGLICEAYPDPSIRRFGLWPEEVAPRASYKSANVEVRRKIVERLVARAKWLTISDEQFEACVAFDDNLDALVCALVARAAERGITEPPPRELLDEVETEGWIHLPAPDALQQMF